MRVFVLGNTHSGKTPLAQRIAATLDLQLVSAGAWARRQCPQSGSSMEEYVARVTEYSVSELRRQFDASLNSLRRDLDVSRPAVIEGERNPYDFVHLFAPKSDFAISLHCESNDRPANHYESGLQIIWSYLDWLRINGFMDDSQDRRYSFSCLYYHQREDNADECLERLIDPIVSRLQDDIGCLIDKA